MATISARINQQAARMAKMFVAPLSVKDETALVMDLEDAIFSIATSDQPQVIPMGVPNKNILVRPEVFGSGVKVSIVGERRAARYRHYQWARPEGTW